MDTQVLEKFSCPHIIPKCNFRAVTFAKFQNSEYDFRFNTRDAQMKNLAELLVETCNSAPGGTIIFLQSYKFKEKFQDFLSSSGYQDKISKKLFFEQADDHSVFGSYQAHIASEHSGLLLCVIGGRLSEGINFSDDLARTLIIAGLPYANN